MDLDFTPEQLELRQLTKELCTRYANLSRVRQLENDAIGYSPDFWSALTESGITGMMIPERFGGSEMTMLDAAVVYEEFGRSLAPSPHFVSSVLGARIVMSTGTSVQQATLLPSIAAGTAILTPAWLEPDGSYGPTGIRLRADADDHGWVLNGIKQHVLFAMAATHLIVLARVVDGPGTGIALFLVDRSTDGVTLTQQQSLASDSQYRVTFEEVRIDKAALLGTVGGGWTKFSSALQDGIILLAAQAVGGALQAHHLSVEYAKTRHQFDKPLGAFQALAHYLADRSAEVDGAQVLVWDAAWCHDHERPIGRIAPMAKLFACEAFRKATATAVQIFGGNGFTVDYDIQLYFRRAKQLEISFWDRRYLEELIAEDVLGSAEVG